MAARKRKERKDFFVSVHSQRSFVAGSFFAWFAWFAVKARVHPWPQPNRPRRRPRSRNRKRKAGDEDENEDEQEK
jgi:hypothetical protein